MAEAQPSFSFNYSITARERREGLKMLRSPPWSMPGTSKKEPLGHTLIGIAVGLVIVALVIAPPRWFISLFVVNAPDEAGALITAVIVLLGIGSVWMIGTAWLQRLAVFQRLRCWGSALTTSIEERGVVDTVPGVSTCFAWGHYRGMTEGKSVIILWSAIDRGYMIPKRLFGDPPQQEAAIRFIEAHVAKPAIPIPGGFEVLQ